MRHCRKILFFLSVIFFAFPVISASNPSASVKQDSSSRTAVKQIGASTDTSEIIQNVGEKRSGPPQSAVSKTLPKSAADSLGLFGNPAKASLSRDSLQPNTREMFRSLGNFHKAMGIYNISAGILAVIAGAAILDKQDILPFSLSLITLGGITVGIGVWEITIGRTLGR
jgi:hypothetical protein